MTISVIQMLIGEPSDHVHFAVSTPAELAQPLRKQLVMLKAVLLHLGSVDYGLGCPYIHV